MDIYHHQIGKSLFLGSRTEYFAESSRDEYSICPCSLKPGFYHGTVLVVLQMLVHEGTFLL